MTPLGWVQAEPDMPHLVVAEVPDHSCIRIHQPPHTLGVTLAAKDRRGSDNEVGVHAYAQGDGTLSTGCVAAYVHKLSPRLVMSSITGGNKA